MNRFVYSAFYQAIIGMASMSNSERLLPERIRPVYGCLHLTENCNSRCISCNCWEAQSDDLISTERALQLIQELKDLRIPILRLAGGEPLMRRDLFEILGAINKGDFLKIVLSTNGILLHKYHQQINASPITTISASLDGVGQNNDRIRGISGHYEMVLEGLKKIKNKKIKIGTTITKYSSNDLPALYSLCEKNGYELDINLPDVDIPFFSSKNIRAAMEELWPRPAEIVFIMDFLRRKKILKGYSLQRIRRYLETKKLQREHCLLGYIGIYISSDGTVRPGCFLLPSSGDIGRLRLVQIINSETYRKNAMRMFHLRCVNCTCGHQISSIYENPLRNFSYFEKLSLR